jgi:hypothetical protein
MKGIKRKLVWLLYKAGLHRLAYILSPSLYAQLYGASFAKGLADGLNEIKGVSRGGRTMTTIEWEEKQDANR